MPPAPQDVSPINHLAEEIIPVVWRLKKRTEKCCRCLPTMRHHQREIPFGPGGWFVSEQMWGVYTNVLEGSSNLATYALNYHFGLIATPVQLLLTWRIMVVTETRLWTCIIVPIAMLAFGGSMWATIEFSFKPAFSQLAEFRVAPITGLVSFALTDLIITGVLVYSLVVTVQTGALTAIFALSQALAFVILKNTAMLNARDSWTNGGNALLPASSNDVHCQSGSNFWRSMAPQNLSHMDIEIHSELNGEMGVQRNDLVTEAWPMGPKLPLSQKEGPYLKLWYIKNNSKTQKDSFSAEIVPKIKNNLLEHYIYIEHIDVRVGWASTLCLKPPHQRDPVEGDMISFTRVTGWTASSLQPHGIYQHSHYIGAHRKGLIQQVEEISLTRGCLLMEEFKDHSAPKPKLRAIYKAKQHVKVLNSSPAPAKFESGWVYGLMTFLIRTDSPLVEAAEISP
ncbi:hypothetical protein C8J56DRAFT_1031999 [Mycena floridula]|nr:hypothetical protein C8J56DRAFT_1031999 [Mycena floridula]